MSDIVIYTIITVSSIGIVAAGIAFNYLMENYEDGKCPHPVLKISQYPLPKRQVRKIYEDCDKVLVLEDGYPFIEELLRDFLVENQKVIGRLTGHVNRVGELNPDRIAKALGFEVACEPAGAFYIYANIRAVTELPSQAFSTT